MSESPYLIKREHEFPWLCENVFCASRDVCICWENCIDCKIRAKFLNYALSDRRPVQTVWGQALRKSWQTAKRERKRKK